jgi:hypothetical protein
MKRGILDFGGNILKFLFGTLTQSDAENFNQHITQLETEQREFLRISKEQIHFFIQHYHAEGRQK